MSALIAQNNDVGMYQNIAVMLCRVLALYIFVNFATSLYMFFAAFIDHGYAEHSEEYQIMRLYSIGQMLHLLFMAAFGLYLWFGALNFSKIIIKPLQLETDLPSVNADKICSYILMAAGFIILTFSFQHFARWLPYLISGNSIRDWEPVGISIAYSLVALLLIITPSGFWNIFKKIRTL